MPLRAAKCVYCGRMTIVNDDKSDDEVVCSRKSCLKRRGVL